MLDEMMPPQVAAVETFVDVAEPDLFPEEEAAVARAVAKRRREFGTVRHCARRALARFGVPPVAIVPGARGAPRWPAGIVGSMTHCAGYRAAAVARAGEIGTLGIDAEPDEPLPAGVERLVAVDQERAWLAEWTDRTPSVCWDRLLFSAKESVYKAWFPVAGRWLGFSDAVVTLTVAADGRHGGFSARLLASPPLLAGRELTGFEGRWLARDGLVLTAIAVPAP